MQKTLFDMKEKIIAAIKAKFPAVNLSKKRLDVIAAIIEKKVIDDETKIDATIDAFNEYNPIADIAKQDDALRNLDKQVKEAAKTTPTTKKEETPAAAADEDGTPAWAKALIDSNKALTNDLAILKGEKIADSMKAKATEKLKDVPGSFWSKRALPETDEALEAFVTDVKTDFTAFTKELTDKGLGNLKAPPAGSGGTGGAGGGGGNAKIDPAIEQFGQKQAGKSGMGISISGPVPIGGTPATAKV